jgi:hypothetical protein
MTKKGIYKGKIMKFNDKQKAFQFLLYVLAILGVAAIIYNGILSKSAATAFAQTDPFLSQRLNQIESRFSSLESRLNRLEQQSRLPTITQPATRNNDTEINLLRSETATLSLRLAEAECALARLDERTLTNAARQARRKSSAAPNDRCRLNADAPVQLSARP